jgi:hypothetical protein
MPEHVSELGEARAAMGAAVQRLSSAASRNPPYRADLEKIVAVLVEQRRLLGVLLETGALP